MTVDLTTRYLGMELVNPLVPSASPLGADLDLLRRLEAAGAAAVVLPSLFEEQIEHEAMEIHRLYHLTAESFAEAPTGYFPELDGYNTGPERYLDHLEKTKHALNIPVVASLNGTTRGGWVRYARLMESAGADALELNVYLVANDPDVPGTQVEERYLELVSAVKEQVRIPLAVKIAPYFSSPAHMARRLVDVGADGLVLFNRFYQPDIDIERLEVAPGLELSTPNEVRLPLHWIAALEGRVGASLAASTGVHSATEAVKLLLVGADVVMMASALLRHGPDHLTKVLEDLRTWLEEHGYVSVRQMRGSMSLRRVPDPSAFERVNYMRTIISYTPPFLAGAESPDAPRRSPTEETRT
ncbi:MAG: dihydroorotate dehydrogenase [Acidimicrobiia bacterium]|nr:MAG: dihydroorotate dehydrogenase [Acidimicrobiia bacterium]